MQVLLSAIAFFRTIGISEESSRRAANRDVWPCLGHIARAAFLSLTVVMAGSDLQAQYLGPTPYLSATDSPWSGLDFSDGYFHLEDFESAPALKPGLSLDTFDFSVPLFPSADSVDGDDGDPTDGNCHPCNAWWSGGEGGVMITFDVETLGSYPTHVGLVCTDIVPGATFIIEGFNPSGGTLGQQASTGLGDDNFSGGTAEDRFVGLVAPEGISAMQIKAVGSGSGGLEIDHVQYGAGLVPAAPASCIVDRSEEVLAVAAGMLPGSALIPGAIESNENVKLLIEREVWVIDDVLNLDAAAPGVYADFGDLVPSTIPGGSAVSSYLVHFDGVDVGVFFQDVELTFAVPILGVIALDVSLDVSDALLGAPSISYPTGEPTRGLEMHAQFDAFELSSDMRTIRFDLELTGKIDQLRIVTAACDSDPWSNEGCALDGLNGPPLLMGTGPLVAGSVNTLALMHAAALAPAAIFASLTESPIPFKGGTLKPSLGQLSTLVLATDMNGEFTIAFVWPASVPGSTNMYVQFAVLDAGAVQGVALSNALRGVSLP